MTQKEKAEELVFDFYNVNADSVYDGITMSMAKQCALIAVEEKVSTYRLLFPFLGINCKIEESTYYKDLMEVKQEIEKL